MRNLPVMGPLWFTAHWMPVPWVYSPPAHIPCSISLSIPLSGCLHHPRAYNGNPPQTLSLTDGKRKLRLKDNRAKEREGKGERTEVGSERDLAELCFLCEFVVTTETLPPHTEACTLKTHLVNGAQGLCTVRINTFTHSCTLYNHKPSNACKLCTACMHEYKHLQYRTLGTVGCLPLHLQHTGTVRASIK